MSGSVTISSSGVPARLRSMPDHSPGLELRDVVPLVHDLPASSSRWARVSLTRCGAVADEELDRAALDDRRLVLADLVALGQVGIEIVLAREDRQRRDRRADGEAEADRPLDGAAVEHRQRARQRQVDRPRPACWARPRTRSTEPLKIFDRSRAAHASRCRSRPRSRAPAARACRCGRSSLRPSRAAHACQSVACWKACAACNSGLRRSSWRSAASRPACPAPAAPKPAGTLMPGSPARLATGCRCRPGTWRAVAALLAQLPGDRRRDRPGDHVAASESRLEVVGDHATHLLRLQVVGVVVAVRKHVRAEHDAALHLGAEALGAGCLTSRTGRRSARRDARSARRRSAPGSTTLRPARSCNTPGSTAPCSAAGLDQRRAQPCISASAARNAPLDVARRRGREELLRHADAQALQRPAAVAPSRVAALPRGSPAAAARRSSSRADRSRSSRRARARSPALRASTPAWSSRGERDHPVARQTP